LSCCDTRRWSNHGKAASRMRRWTPRIWTSVPPATPQIKNQKQYFNAILFDTFLHIYTNRKFNMMTGVLKDVTPCSLLEK
jgi:hypothetical protein